MLAQSLSLSFRSLKANNMYCMGKWSLRIFKVHCSLSWSGFWWQEGICVRSGCVNGAWVFVYLFCPFPSPEGQGGWAFLLLPLPWLGLLISHPPFQLKLSWNKDALYRWSTWWETAASTREHKLGKIVKQLLSIMLSPKWNDLDWLSTTFALPDHISQLQDHKRSLESLYKEDVMHLSGLWSAALSLLLTLKSEPLSVRFLLSKMGIHSHLLIGSCCGSDGRESTCNAGNLGSIPGLGRSTGGGHSYPL